MLYGYTDIWIYVSLETLETHDIYDILEMGTLNRTEWLIDWLSDLLSEWLSEWLREWLTEWVTEWVTLLEQEMLTHLKTIAQILLLNIKMMTHINVQYQSFFNIPQFWRRMIFYQTEFHIYKKLMLGFGIYETLMQFLPLYNISIFPTSLNFDEQWYI